MIWPNKPFYVVSCFERATHLDLGAWEFSVGIDINLARRAFNEEMSQKTYDRFIEEGNYIVKRIGLASEERMIMPPYVFLPNEEGKLTSLLHFVRVPGNACDLGVHGSDLDGVRKDEDYYSRPLEYNPHNVDSHTQAYGLLALWTNWADSVYASFKDKDEE